MFRAKSTAITLLPVAVLLLFAPFASRGLESDRNEPIHIEADRATLDEKNEINNFEGNVYLRQGSLELRGDRVTVYLSGRKFSRMTLTGRPAHMQQRRDNESAVQQAEATTIEYNAVDERVVLLGNARVWQNEAEQFSSERIEFNLKESTVNAGGENSKDRVHITLQPKNGGPDNQAEPRP